MKPIRFYIFVFLLSLQNAYGCEIGNDDIFSVTKGNQTCNFTALQICSSFLEIAQSDDIDKLVTAANSTGIVGNMAVFAAGTAALLYTVKEAPDLWRKVISPAWSMCFKKTGSEVLDISEVLPDTMEEVYISHLRDIDETLTESTLSTDKSAKNPWRKFPIYGRFRDHRNSWSAYLDCRKCKKAKDNMYIYGFFYENGTYKVEIAKWFCVKPLDQISLYRFYAIHEMYKKRSKRVKKEPQYYPLVEKSGVSSNNAPPDEKEKKLPQHTDEVVIELKENLSSVDPAENDSLKKNSTRKEEKTALPHKRLNFDTLMGVDLDAVEDFIKDFIKDNVVLQHHFPSMSLRHDPLELLFKLRKGNSKKGKLPDYRIQFALVSDDKKLSTHLYCLFPTVPQGKENDEEYKILLHIKRVGKRFPFYIGSIPDDVQFLTKTSNKLLHFKLAEVTGDGDCGFGAIGTTRLESLKLLRQSADDTYVRRLVAPEIVKSLIDVTLDEKVKSMFSELQSKYEELLEQENAACLSISERLGFKEENRKVLDELLRDDGASKEEKKNLRKIKKSISKVRAEMQKHAEGREVYLGFLENFNSAGSDDRGWINHSPNIEEEGNTGLYDAVAYLNELNFYIWQLPEGQTQLTLIHRFEGGEQYRNAHVLHNGEDHYDKLECKEDSAKMSQTSSKKSTETSKKPAKHRKKKTKKEKISPSVSESGIITDNNPKIEKKEEGKKTKETKKVKSETDKKVD